MKLIDIIVNNAYNTQNGTYGLQTITINPEHIVSLTDISYREETGPILYKKEWLKTEKNKVGDWSYVEAVPAPFKMIMQTQILMKGASYESSLSITEIKALVNA